jgi:hypothetical protein
MRKSPGFLSRVFAAVLAIWLGLVITEPLPLDACPMHGVHSMRAMGAMHAMDGGTRSTRDAHPTASHQCTCIGDCTAGVVTGLGATANLDVGVRVVFRAIAPLRSVPGTLLSADHRLPFANGPPELS